MIDIEGTRGGADDQDDSDEEEGVHGQRVGCHQQ